MGRVEVGEGDGQLVLDGREQHLPPFPGTSEAVLRIQYLKNLLLQLRSSS